MLKRLEIQNFTVFGKAGFEFSPGLNVVVGTNGTGKTQLLKLGYLFLRAWPDLVQSHQAPSQKRIDAYLEEKLMGLFRPERLEHLRRHGAKGETTLAAEVMGSAVGPFGDPAADLTRDGTPREPYDLHWHIALRGSADATVEASRSPEDGSVLLLDQPPVFVPSKEIVSLFEGLIALFEKYEIQLDETYRDLAVAMSIPERRKPSPLLSELLDRLKAAIGGELVLEKGRLLLRQPAGRDMAPHLVAEGFRKLGLLLYLVRNEIVAPDRTLFWDEPEANLNPALTRPLIEMLVALAGKGVQVICATHSLFVLREVEILLRQERYRATPHQFFALAPAKGGVRIAQGGSLEEVDPIASLEADLEQSGRFMDVMD